MTTTFKQITLNSGEYVKPKDLKPNTLFHGIFMETIVNPTNEAVSHKIQLTDGREILLSGAAFLNGLLRQVSPGSEVKIKYLGLGSSPGGKWAGKPSHQWDVAVADCPEVCPTTKTPTVALTFTDEELPF